MKKILSTDTEHVIKLVPRFYPTGDLVFSLENQATRITELCVNSYEVVDGLMSVTFEAVVKNKDNFLFTISEGLNIVYKGQIIAKDE